MYVIESVWVAGHLLIINDLAQKNQGNLDEKRLFCNICQSWSNVRLVVNAKRPGRFHTKLC